MGRGVWGGGRGGADEWTRKAVHIGGTHGCNRFVPDTRRAMRCAGGRAEDRGRRIAALTYRNGTKALSLQILPNFARSFTAAYSALGMRIGRVRPAVGFRDQVVSGKLYAGKARPHTTLEEKWLCARGL